LLRSVPLFDLLERELHDGLDRFWRSAGRILDGSGVALSAPPSGYFALERNFFSALFLLSMVRAGIPSARRRLYAGVNQCLRAMVTGCDNLLDDEYKPTLETDLPREGVRFRSVLDIMVADRVLVDLLLEAGESADRVRACAAASLAALTRSGAQEAAEEAGTGGPPLPPERVLAEIHHYKTGLLFQAVWAVPGALGDADSPLAEAMAEALYRIGMGCQILDDLTDLADDLLRDRHNFVAALAFHGDSGAADPDGWERIRAAAREGKDSPSILADVPGLRDQALARAEDFLRDGLGALFGEKGAALVEPSAAFLRQRIGDGAHPSLRSSPHGAPRSDFPESTDAPAP
jgi:hypothetical protein